MAGTQSLDAVRTVAFSFDPNDLIIIDTPGHPLYQKDRNELPVSREAVIAIAIGPPASSLRVRRLEDGRNGVATGRQRTKAACVANAIGAGVPYTGTLRAIKEAIAEFKKDPEFVERVTTLMRNKPIRLSALAANAKIADVRGMIATENALAQAESKNATIAAVQEDVQKYDIPVNLVAEQRGLTVGQVKRMLKVDLSAPPAKPKARGKSTRPSAKRIKALASASGLPLPARLALEWAAGEHTDGEVALRLGIVDKTFAPKVA